MDFGEMSPVIVATSVSVLSAAERPSGGTRVVVVVVGGSVVLVVVVGGSVVLVVVGGGLVEVTMRSAADATGVVGAGAAVQAASRSAKAATV
ncbi:MAG: hypothetical protein R3258_01265 [Acidimicrobiia bacterium]|nr:hypothetical protein [Acidimicrobiia bacterium]